MTICAYCFGPIAYKSIGRVPRFCSALCKQAHWRLSQNGFKRISVSASARSLSLRNAGGTVTQDSLSLRKSGNFSQVDWVGEDQ